ncbi:hypothetical protein LX32DRAFT_684102 [Colletotrichum zoysiae]|uniref:Uncharacterized protein n=1 Tax=Colletotrichum zoysiae TaxID=1216348 RepID=A0AAD9M2S4_9PEZI|nr:hypothetical protein LX32DRAFT_684102 [Colletotrichum zoysiae]
MAPFEATHPLGDHDLNLAKPFTSNDHRALAQEVGRLIKMRGDSKDVQFQQELLMQMSVRMKTKENKFIRRQSKVLGDREKLFELDPSDARARDVEILKSVLSKLRDENQTLKSGRKHKSSGGSDDDIKTKKRKRADETTPALKTAENGVPTVAEGQKDINMNMGKSAKKSKTKHKILGISSSEAASMEKGSNQNANICLQGSKASEVHTGIVEVEINYGYNDEEKKDKAKKRKKSPKPKVSLVVVTEHEEKDDNFKVHTGQVSEVEKYNFGSAGNVEEEIMAKKEAKNKKRGKGKKKQKKEKQRAAMTAASSDDVASIVEPDALKRAKKEKQTMAGILVNIKPESSALSDPIQFTDNGQSAANQGNKKTWQRNRVTNAETNSRVSHAGQDKTQESGSYDPEAAFATANRALKGPMRIAPPVTPVPSFTATAGRTPLNPWSAYRRTCIEGTEKAKKPQDDQVWVLGTTGSRKKGDLDNSDTKTITMTIGKVDSPTKVDQGSPTPPPKKERKKKARHGTKVKKPVVPFEYRPATAQGKTSVPGVRVSEDLVHLITPYAALLGSVERAESLNKLLAKDQELLKEEKKTWFKTIGLQHDG